MIAERYLRRWTAAGLIDAAAAARIGEWERAHARPLGLWAMAGVGVIAIGLGVMAVVGANWEDIPAWLKLGVCFVLQIVLAGVVWHAASRGLAGGVPHLDCGAVASSLAGPQHPAVTGSAPPSTTIGRLTQTPVSGRLSSTRAAAA